jgi:hypothetical protein
MPIFWTVVSERWHHHDPPGDATRYAAGPTQAGALDADDSGLAWEPEGWDEFYAPG